MDKIEALNSLFGDDVVVRKDRVTVKHDGALASPAMDRLVRAAVFGDRAEKEHARWLIWELGQAVGVRASSIEDLYMARGRGETHGLHRTGDQRPRHGLRHGASDFSHRHSSSTPVRSFSKSRVQRSHTPISGRPSTSR